MMHDRILERIKAYDTIIIQRHVRPDPDAYGSQGGLGEIIKASFPDKQVWIVGDEDPSLTFWRRWIRFQITYLKMRLSLSVMLQTSLVFQIKDTSLPRKSSKSIIIRKWTAMEISNGLFQLRVQQAKWYTSCMHPILN